MMKRIAEIFVVMVLACGVQFVSAFDRPTNPAPGSSPADTAAPKGATPRAGPTDNAAPRDAAPKTGAPAAPKPSAPLPANAPNSATEYPLGPGDQLKITVYNNPDLATEAQISESGTINFPLLGDIKIGGLSKVEAEKMLARELVKRKYLNTAQVNVLVTSYRALQASVLGEVKAPGKFTIFPSSTITDLLAQAGGITVEGSRVVTLVQQTSDGKQVSKEINLDSVLASGEIGANLLVKNNDIIYVTKAPLFYIYGEVRKPGAYRLESNMTVRQALSVGGGLTVRGTERRLTINRKGTNGSVSTMDANAATVVKENDVINVAESWF
ncbi:MAG: polysaccharide export protein EpsE [Burkholderiales bacterium]